MTLALGFSRSMICPATCAKDVSLSLSFKSIENRKQTKRDANQTKTNNETHTSSLILASYSSLSFRSSGRHADMADSLAVA